MASGWDAGVASIETRGQVAFFVLEKGRTHLRRAHWPAGAILSALISPEQTNLRREEAEGAIGVSYSTTAAAIDPGGRLDRPGVVSRKK